MNDDETIARGSSEPGHSSLLNEWDADVRVPSGAHKPRSKGIERAGSFEEEEILSADDAPPPVSRFSPLPSAGPGCNPA